MKELIKIFIVLLVTLLMGTRFSYADQHWGHHGTHAYFRYHDHPHFGVRVSAFYPDEYYPVVVGGTRYYYDDGVYYGYTSGTYVVAAPPMGAVVSSIPSDFQAVNINGMTYYTNNGTYYLSTPSGYKVVVPPQGPATPTAAGAIVVNVPNNNGGYVAVTLRKSGNGFVGPRGEFYTSFPHVSELKMTYGR